MQLVCSTRSTGVTLCAMKDLKAASVASMCISTEDMEKAQSEIEDLKKSLEIERSDLKKTLHKLETECSIPFDTRSADAIGGTQ